MLAEFLLVVALLLVQHLLGQRGDEARQGGHPGGLQHDPVHQVLQGRHQARQQDQKQ